MMAEMTLETLTQTYDDAIKKAKTPEAASQLNVEKAQALADFRLQAVAKRERAIWKRDALHDYPLAEEFSDLVAGETEEEVRASAQTLHERLLKRFETHQRSEEERRWLEERRTAQEGTQGGDIDAGSAAV